jgi:hypothetical protein
MDGTKDHRSELMIIKAALVEVAAALHTGLMLGVRFGFQITGGDQRVTPTRPDK